MLSFNFSHAIIPSEYPEGNGLRQSHGKHPEVINSFSYKIYAV